MKKLGLIALLGIASSAASAATAAPIEYRFAANGTGTVNGVTFTNQAYTYVFTADTTTTTDDNKDNTFSVGTITIANTACSGGCTITNPGNYRFTTNYQTSTVIGLEAVAGIALFNEGFFASSPNLNAAVAPLTASDRNGYAPYPSVATSGGPVVLTTNNSYPTFSATLLAAPVPTMTEWAMILFGTILAGGAALYIQRRQMIA